MWWFGSTNRAVIIASRSGRKAPITAPDIRDMEVRTTESIRTTKISKPGTKEPNAKVLKF